MAASLAADLLVALDPARIMHAAGQRPDPWQVRVLREPVPRELLCCARQVGKSTVTGACATHQALCEPGSLTLLVSPSLRQSAELLARIRQFVHALGSPVGVEADSNVSMRFENGSRIVALPGREETIRGFSGVSLLIVDEAARVEDELYLSVRPTLAVSGGRLLCLSTPWGARGWFWREWTGRERWRRTRVSASECPRISAEFLAEERRTMSAAFFAAEYLCEFMDAIDSVFRQADVSAAFDPIVEPLFGEAW